MTEAPEAQPAPTKVCPHCSTMSQTTSDKCPNCGKSYAVKQKKRGGCLRIVLGIIGILIVIGIIGAAVGGKSKPVKASDVTQRVSGTFIRSGCFGCTNTERITTSNVYCGWDGSKVIVHVMFANSSSEKLKVSWHPTYLIQNGTSHGTGLTAMQETQVDPGATTDVFVKQSPKGTAADTPISKCYPSFFDVQAG